jgi:hypothetical protein
MVLPVFVTGKKPEPPKTRPNTPESLPRSERGMLLFVAALLGLGTLAVVAMMGFGLSGSGTPKPSAARNTATQDPPAPSLSAPVVVVPPPDPSPSVVPSPSRARTSPTPRRSPSRIPLGTLTMGDLQGYCQFRRPQLEGQQWSCRPNGPNFTPTTICRWRFNDRTAHAVIGDIRDPSTWRCYT